MYRNKTLIVTVFCKQFLKVNKSILSRSSIFKLFQSGIDLGKKELLYQFVLAYSCNSFKGWFPWYLLQETTLADIDLEPKVICLQT